MNIFQAKNMHLFTKMILIKLKIKIITELRKFIILIMKTKLQTKQNKKFHFILK